MKDIFVLTKSSDNKVLGVFNSRICLKNAVDHWIKIYPKETLFFSAYMPNYIPGKILDQCYAYIGECLLPPYNENGLVDVGVNLVGHYNDDIKVHP